MSNKYKIKDSVSQRMHKVFIDDTEKKSRELYNLIQNENLKDKYKELFNISHFYSGNARYFGLDELEDIAGDLNKSIKKNDSPDIVLSKTQRLYEILMQILEAN